MSYKEAINLLSNAILNFDQELDPNLLNFLDKGTQDRIRVYRKNYFFGAFESLSDDFECLKAHCESDNFRYLVRDFLLKNKIRCINIEDLSINFISYLDKAYDLHQDAILVPLAAIDLLYRDGHFQNQTKINLPRGVFDYWCYLSKQTDTYENIDLENFETIVVIEEDGERYLGKLGTTDEV